MNKERNPLPGFLSFIPLHFLCVCVGDPDRPTDFLSRPPPLIHVCAFYWACTFFTFPASGAHFFTLLLFHFFHLKKVPALVLMSTSVPGSGRLFLLLAGRPAPPPPQRANGSNDSNHPNHLNHLDDPDDPDQSNALRAGVRAYL